MATNLSVPPKVQGLAASMDENGCVKLEWYPLKLKLFPIINYNVQILPSKKVLWSQSFSYTTKTTNINITLPAGKYKIRVRGISRMGLGTPSDEIYIRIGGVDERRERDMKSLTNQEKQRRNHKQESNLVPKTAVPKNEEKFHKEQLSSSFHHVGGACGYSPNEYVSPSHYTENTASSYSADIHPIVQAGCSYGNYPAKSGHVGANTGADASGSNKKWREPARNIAYYGYSQQRAASSYPDESNVKFNNQLQRAAKGKEILKKKIMVKKANISKITGEIRQLKDLSAELTAYEGSIHPSKDELPVQIQIIQSLKNELQVLTDEEENLRCQLESLKEAISKKIESNLIENEKVLGDMSKLEDLLKELGL